MASISLLGPGLTGEHNQLTGLFSRVVISTRAVVCVTGGWFKIDAVMKVNPHWSGRFDSRWPTGYLPAAQITVRRPSWEIGLPL